MTWPVNWFREFGVGGCSFAFCGGKVNTFPLMGNGSVPCWIVPGRKKRRKGEREREWGRERESGREREREWEREREQRERTE